MVSESNASHAQRCNQESEINEFSEELVLNFLLIIIVP